MLKKRSQVRDGKSTKSDRVRHKAGAKKKLSEEYDKLASRMEYQRSAENGCGSCGAIGGILDAVFGKEGEGGSKSGEMLYQLKPHFLLREIDPVRGEDLAVREVQLFNPKGMYCILVFMYESN